VSCDGFAKERSGPTPDLIATHISIRNLGHRELAGILAAEGIRAAYDGMKISIRPGQQKN
jgi:hypothetical protein